MRVLIVDDEPNIILSAKRVLEWNGHEVESVSDGMEALIKIRETMPDIVVIDYIMPGMHGEELIEKIRADKSFDNLKIIYTPQGMCLADDQAEYRKALMQNNPGFDLLLCKPYNQRELLEFVNHTVKF